MKQILCLEATWWKDSPISVQPFLETLRMLEGVFFSRLTCNSVADLKHHLSQPTYKNGILYMAMHGRRGKLSFSDTKEKEMVTLPQLADMMSTRFNGWHIHFATCETINVSDEIFQNFKKKTGVGTISGYMKQVDWIEGYALDMLLLQKAQNYSRPTALANYMNNNYAELMARTGMYIE